MRDNALRAVHRKIEDQIAHKEIEVAIRICQKILKKYPKNLATYKLLGKAFLDDSRLDLAEKVFDVIQKIDPDDFVSHIGKSFIAESNGKLKQAVESMERAFELQPANEMLQEEVKRLLKLKNGVEPNRVRLTRGSLIKMYLSGKLFEQAMGEIRLGIHESPNRTDFKVNFAECLFNLEIPIQAVEVCIDVLSALPYSWTANEIIDKVINSDAEDNQESLSRSRLIELDPYYEFMQPTTPSILDVPDIAVQFDTEQEVLQEEVDWLAFIEDAWDTDSISDELDIKSVFLETSEDEIKKGDDPDSVDFRNSISAQSRRERFITKLRSNREDSKDIQDVPDWIFDKEPEELMDSDLKFDANEESNLVDLSTQELDPPLQEVNQDEFHREWHSEENESGEFDESPDIEDTQKLIVNTKSVEDQLIEAQKAIVGENIHHAYNLFSELVQNNEKLEQVIQVLETTIGQHPDLADIALLLGKAYLQTGQKMKANQIFLEIQTSQDE